MNLWPWRRLRELEDRVAELERIAAGGHTEPHDFQLTHAGKLGSWVERCQLPGCDRWRGQL